MTPPIRLNQMHLPRYLIKTSPTTKPHALDAEIRNDGEALVEAKQLQALKEVEWSRRKAKGEKVGNRPQIELLKVLWVGPGTNNHEGIAEGKEKEDEVLRNERRSVQGAGW